MMEAMTVDGSTMLLLSILAIAVWIDIRRHRIPNVLSLGGIALGTALQASVSGLSGLAAGLAGAAVAIGILLPFYMFRGMGAGDVKLMGAVGAFLGPHKVLLATGLSLGAGGVLALLILMARGGLRPLARRYWATLKCLLITRKFIHEPPGKGEVAAMKFPYAAAIGIGTLAAIMWLSTLPDLSGFISLLTR